MNDGLLVVIALALLPALGNLGGGLLAEWLRPSDRVLNYSLHAAAGIILAVIAIEVMPKALEKVPTWILALAFLLGGAVYLLVKKGVERWQESKRTEEGVGAGAWMVYVAVATDLIGDGLLIGAGSVVSFELALTLALGQVLADIPEGYATIANFRVKGMSRSKRLLLSASLVVPIVGGAIFAYFVLRNQSEALKMAGLVFVAGLYMLAAVEDMLNEAHESTDDNSWSAVSFLLGFALFIVVSGELG